MVYSVWDNLHISPKQYHKNVTNKTQVFIKVDKCYSFSTHNKVHKINKKGL